MTFSKDDERYMRRALQLAANGRGHVSPNPMVGAVIVAPDGRVIGEGWHRRFGGPHAEVNAVRAVAEPDRALLPLSTIYVTLEPCSHYGKTPPCAGMLVDQGIGRVVVAAGDPNPKVSGRGIGILRDAGIEVEEGLLAGEAEALNRTFMTSQRLRRPFVTLKWARSADGFMDHVRAVGEGAARFSTPLSSQLVHRRRAEHDAIAVGAGTVLADNPRLDTRLIAGESPRPVIFDRQKLLAGRRAAVFAPGRRAIHITEDRPLAETLHSLFADEGISSLLVEGGPSLLGEFIASGLWDEAYEEVSPMLLGARGRAVAPRIEESPVCTTAINDNLVNFYSHTPSGGVKNI